jgi:hypothetical protein
MSGKELEIVVAGYKLLDIFVLIGVYVGGAWLSYHAIEWLTRPSKGEGE